MLDQIHATRCRHNWPEPTGWIMNRPNGLNEYVFLHFLTPVELLLHGEIHQLAANSCLIYNVGTPQWFTCQEPMRHNWIHLAGDVPEALERLSLKTDTIYHLQNPKFITQLTRDIESEFLSQFPLYEEMAKAKLQTLLLMLSRSCNNNNNEVLTRRLNELRQHLIADPKHPWGVEEMAAHVGLSTSYFQTVYKRCFRISPVEDLIRIRIDTAKFLLSNGSMPVFEIAEELGYQSESHFCRQFKQRTGISAGEYRANSTFISNAKRKKREKSV